MKEILWDWRSDAIFSVICGFVLVVSKEMCSDLELEVQLSQVCFIGIEFHGRVGIGPISEPTISAELCRNRSEEVLESPENLESMERT